MLRRDPPIEIQQPLQVANASAQSLLQLLNDLLDVSKIEAARMEIVRTPTNVAGLVHEVTSTFASSAQEKQLQLSAEVALDPQTSWSIDPVRLKQVLLNLVGNAIKFTPAGEVKVTVRHQAEPVLQPSGLSHGGGWLVFDVIDTGIGIEPGKESLIFEPFQQADGSTSRRFGGSGLGLAIAQQLVRLMGGSIRVASTSSAGSDFRFEIPAIAATASLNPNLLLTDQQEHDASAVVNNTPQAHQPHRNGFSRSPTVLRRWQQSPRVLVVDDNPVNRHITEQLLRDHGCA